MDLFERLQDAVVDAMLEREYPTAEIGEAFEELRRLLREALKGETYDVRVVPGGGGDGGDRGRLGP